MGGVSKSHVGKRGYVMGGAYSGCGLYRSSSHAPIKASLQDEALMVQSLLYLKYTRQLNCSFLDGC